MNVQITDASVLLPHTAAQSEVNNLLGFRQFSLSIKWSKRMSYIWMAIIGFIVGLVARALLPGDQKLGLIMTALLGIAGSFIANLAGQALGFYAAGSTAGFVASVLGAIVLLGLYGMIAKRAG